MPCWRLAPVTSGRHWMWPPRNWPARIPSMRLADPRLLVELKQLGVEVRPGERLAEWTSLGIGGTTDLLVVRERRYLPELVQTLRRAGIPFRLLGGGTNLLVADGELPWVVLHLARSEPTVSIAGRRVWLDAAEDLGRAVTTCARANLGGMEGLVGVPGSVGGALRMNAGAYGTEIGPLVRSVSIFHGAAGVREEAPAGALGFKYRKSSFAPDDVMLSVTLDLPDRPFPEIMDHVKQLNKRRLSSQPLKEKSAGCIFKNPPGLSTGKMIDELGMKGTRVGGAVISERHANFIVNRHNATAADI